MIADTIRITIIRYGRLPPKSPLIQLFRKSSSVVNDSPCGIGTRNIRIPNAEPSRNFKRFPVVICDFSISSLLMFMIKRALLSYVSKQQAFSLLRGQFYNASTRHIAS